MLLVIIILFVISIGILGAYASSLYQYRIFSRPLDNWGFWFIVVIIGVLCVFMFIQINKNYSSHPGQQGATKYEAEARGVNLNPNSSAYSYLRYSSKTQYSSVLGGLLFPLGLGIFSLVFGSIFGLDAAKYIWMLSFIFALTIFELAFLYRSFSLDRLSYFIELHKIPVRAGYYFRWDEIALLFINSVFAFWLLNKIKRFLDN